MTASSDSDRDATARRHAARYRRSAVGMVVLAAAAVSAARTCHSYRVGREVPVDPEAASRLRSGVDPNTAAWFELAQLPGIGETLARRIVEYREQQRTSPDAPASVYSQPSDLTRVRGIGDRTVARLRPFLRFGPDEAAATPTR